MSEIKEIIKKNTCDLHHGFFLINSAKPVSNQLNLYKVQNSPHFLTLLYYVIIVPLRKLEFCYNN